VTCTHQREEIARTPSAAEKGKAGSSVGSSCEMEDRETGVP